jgi:hypothetical protein
MCSLLLLHCEEPVELNIDVPKSRLVINSSFYPNQLVTLRVSATRPPGTPPVNITDARVSLFEAGKLAEELVYVPAPEEGGYGSYRTRRFTPRVGSEYTIYVAVDGYDPVTAVSSIPAPVAIEELSLSNVSIDMQQGAMVYDYTLTVSYADPPEEQNYYDLRVYQRVIPFSVSEQGDTLMQHAYLKSVGTPSRHSTDKTVSVLLRDRGGAKNVSVQLQSRINSKRELLAEVVAELRTVSPEYYYYQRSINAEDLTPSNGLSEPIIIFDNVDQGLGIFAGYNVVQQHLPLVRD